MLCRTLKVWNAESGTCVHTLYGHTSTVRCMHLHNSKVRYGTVRYRYGTGKHQYFQAPAVDAVKDGLAQWMAIRMHVRFQSLNCLKSPSFPEVITAFLLHVGTGTGTQVFGTL